MELIAHRGFADCGPENVVPTLRRTCETADAVEFDVRLARDDEPVVFHDPSVDRLTANAGPVADYSATELSRMAVGDSDTTIPTLERVLTALGGPIVADLKCKRVTDRLVGLLRDHEAPVLVSCFDPTVLAAVPDALDTALLSAPADRHDGLPEGSPADVAEAIAVATELDARGLHPHHSQCSPLAVGRAQAAGLRVNAWTVRSAAVARQMREVGVDGVIADSPDYDALPGPSEPTPGQSMSDE